MNQVLLEEYQSIFNKMTTYNKRSYNSKKEESKAVENIMKILDTVTIKKTNEKFRIEQVIKTYRFKPTTTITYSYILSDGKEYNKNELEFDKVLSRENRLKDLLS